MFVGSDAQSLFLCHTTLSLLLISSVRAAEVGNCSLYGRDCRDGRDGRDGVCLPSQCTGVRAGATPSSCDATISNQLFYDNTKKRLSLCNGYDWIHFIGLSATEIGSYSNPAPSCHFLAGPKARNGIYWIKPVHSGCGSAKEVFCAFDLMDRGCSLVWKHSYIQVSPTNDMRTFSRFNKPCLDLLDGWCNVGKKECLGGSEQVTAAYHHRQLVYAYRGDRNLQLGKSWQGAILNNPFVIVDRCANTDSKAVGVAPEPTSDSFIGVAFDKYNQRVYTGNCDTVTGGDGKGDCRWANCQLPPSISSSTRGVQMTTAIFVC